ncbi:MAG: hypothetical protein RLO81_04540 [Fulvivirga sp.]|uniref:hypothetical protein n=1 Tax=Fulvivirga sp. TaxID=1931237 RepID=UPI0032EE6718
MNNVSFNYLYVTVWQINYWTFSVGILIGAIAMTNEVDFKILGDWNMQKEQLLLEYSQLTNADLEFREGGESELLYKMSSRLHLDNNVVIKIIQNNFFKLFDVPEY